MKQLVCVHTHTPSSEMLQNTVPGPALKWVVLYIIFMLCNAIIPWDFGPIATSPRT